jgi:hypothetical protein
MQLQDVAAALRPLGLHPLVLMQTAILGGLLERWQPVVAVVAANAQDVHSLLHALGASGVPTLLVGDSHQIRRAAQFTAVQVAIPAPALGAEIAEAANLIARELPAPDRLGYPSSIAEFGPLRLDLSSGTAWVDGRPCRLPRREFSILAELARHPGRPIAPVDLARRAWPDEPYAGAEQIRRYVYRLRKLLGDQGRASPLIRTRPGFGYLIEA